MQQRMTWKEICHCEDYRGRWVALDDCRYDEASGKASEGAVVDVDDDLVDLCQRLRESALKNCAIVFCEEEEETEPARPSAPPAREMRRLAH